MRSIVIHLPFHEGNNLIQWTAYYKEAATDLGVIDEGRENEIT
jgi:hypothetical protein